MSKLANLLESIKSGKTKTVRGVAVCRRGDIFVIDGVDHDLDAACELLAEANIKRGIDYNNTGFVLRQPHSDDIISAHRLRDKKEHNELIEDAKRRGLYVWYGTVVRTDDGVFMQQPLLIDFDSVPDTVGEIEENQKLVLVGYECPFCSKSLNSSFGRTNHVNAKHADRLDEYQRLLGSVNEDVCVLKCPHCNKVAKTKSGLTNHIKAKHE